MTILLYYNMPCGDAISLSISRGGKRRLAAIRIAMHLHTRVRSKGTQPYAVYGLRETYPETEFNIIILIEHLNKFVVYGTPGIKTSTGAYVNTPRRPERRWSRWSSGDK